MLTLFLGKGALAVIRLKQILQKILFPKWWLVLLSVPIAAAGLVLAFTEKLRPQWIAYIIYVFSACSLTWVCAFVCRSAGHGKETLNTTIERIPVLQRYRTDVSFNMRVSLYRSLGLNILYAAAKFALGLYYRSVWFAALGVYYFLLALIRFTLLRGSNGGNYGAKMRMEWKRYRMCGALLLVMSLALTGVVILVVQENEGFHYAGYLIYIMAMYAFYNITAAIINVIKYRRYKSPVMSAAKVLQLAAALVSLLALETAMLAQFGSNDGEHFRAVMSGATGGGVCTIILGIAVYMIRRATKEIRMEEKP